METPRWRFPKIGAPKISWFMMANPVKMDDRPCQIGLGSWVKSLKIGHVRGRCSFTRGVTRAYGRHLNLVTWVYKSTNIYIYLGPKVCTWKWWIYPLFMATLNGRNDGKPLRLEFYMHPLYLGIQWCCGSATIYRRWFIQWSWDEPPGPGVAAMWKTKFHKPPVLEVSFILPTHFWWNVLLLVIEPKKGPSMKKNQPPKIPKNYTAIEESLVDALLFQTMEVPNIS